VKVFGDKEVMLDGPVNIKIKICGLEIVNPFYYVNADIPAIGGYDLMRVAHIIIDTNRSEVWSKHPDVAEPVQMSQNVAEMMKPFSSVPGTSPAECDQNAPVPDAMAPCPQTQPRYVTIADNQECRPQSWPRTQSLSVTEDTSQRPLSHTGEMTSTQNDFCCVPNAKPQFSTALCSQNMNASAPPFFPVEKDSGTATLDMPTHELPDHINLLYETTVAQTRLSADVDRQFRDMLHRRASTFASSFKDLGFCPLLLYDVDTGDAAPIKQSPRRPPLSAGNAEDEILDEMLSTGVIEPSIAEWASPVCLVK